MRIKKMFVVKIDGHVQFDKMDINKESLENVIRCGHPSVDPVAISIIEI